MIILLSGKAKSGKSTIAGIIKKYYNINTDELAEIFSFGDYVKSTANFMGWDGKKDAKGRTLLQVVGQIGRNYNINTWVNMCIDEINYVNPDIAVVDDLRFKSELARIKEEFKDVITIRVNRLNFESDLTEEQKQDISETDLDNYNDWDFVIENDGNLNDLKRKVLKIIE